MISQFVEKDETEVIPHSTNLHHAFETSQCPLQQKI